MAFNLMNLINRTEDVKNQDVVMLDIEQLIPHEKNRQIKDIDKLAEAIEAAGGIKQPLLVRKMDNGYKILAGHRRTAAARILIAQGNTEYSQLPCIVETNLDEEEQEILLILLNEQQEKSDYEKIQDAMRLKELIGKKKKDENIPGSVRSLTAEALGETPTQIARYESIDKNLVPELKDGKIGISAAYEASRLEPERQQQIISQPDRTIKTVKKLSDSDKSERQQKKAQRERLKEDLAAYICDELCKHTSKKEENLIKECNRCKVWTYLEAMK